MSGTGGLMRTQVQLQEIIIGTGRNGDYPLKIDFKRYPAIQHRIGDIKDALDEAKAAGIEVFSRGEGRRDFEITFQKGGEIIFSYSGGLGFGFNKQWVDNFIGSVNTALKQAKGGSDLQVIPGVGGALNINVSPTNDPLYGILKKARDMGFKIEVSNARGTPVTIKDPDGAVIKNISTNDRPNDRQWRQDAYFTLLRALTEWEQGFRYNLDQAYDAVYPLKLEKTVTGDTLRNYGIGFHKTEYEPRFVVGSESYAIKDDTDYIRIRPGLDPDHKNILILEVFNKRDPDGSLEIHNHAINKKQKIYKSWIDITK